MEGISRPEVSILGEDAIIPARNLIEPAPNQFTHRVTRAVPFYFGMAADNRPPAGELAAETDVVLMVHDGGQRCRVVDGRGLYVEIAYDCLRSIS